MLASYAGSGISISTAVKLNVLPDVTAWDDDREPVANKRELLVSVIAKCVAVPVAVTDAPEIALSVTLRPDVSPSAGAEIVMLVVLPSVFVDVAAVYVDGSALQISTRFASVSRTVSPLSYTRSASVAISNS